MGVRTILERLPAARPGSSEEATRGSAALLRLIWGLALGAGVAGLGAYAFGAGIPALWLFSAATIALALVLPLPYALVSPLFMGLLGWLVDMVPLVALIGWATVVARWAFGVLRARRLPRGGPWIWLPVALLVWTALGVLVIPSEDIKHFVLLVGIQALVSGTLLLMVDRLGPLEDRVRVASGLVGFVLVLSVAVLLQWIGLPIQDLQDDTVADRVETAYGVDAFDNNVGMIKYTRSRNAGVKQLRDKLARLRSSGTELPPAAVFLPRFQAYKESIVVRFAGSARAHESDLRRLDIRLAYDSVGFAPANLIPRLRSFPRNALTYAGVCAGVFPVAAFLAWTQTQRRRLLGRAGMAACLFGAAFSLARGAWAALAVGIVILVVDGLVVRRAKIEAVAAFVVAALVLTVVFLVRYDVDPFTARAGAEGSVTTRQDLYSDTVESVNGLHIILGFGSERTRVATGGSRAFGNYGRYVPRAGTHSTYLNYLFRTGVPGALAIVAIYLIAALHARAAARERSGTERIFYTALTAAAVVVAAHGVVLSLYVEPFYTIVVTLLLGLAMAGTTGLRRSFLPWRRAET
ncbi:MAG: O-antigen ligase family protein [Actinomycetota bacterium]